MKNRILIGLLALVLSIGQVPAHAVTDPYPELNAGDEIPGTRVWSTTETTMAEFFQNTYRTGWACPRIETPNGDPYAMDGNGFDEAAQKWFRVCLKNPWRVYDAAAWDAYRASVAAAQAAAEAASRAWNSANPGRQKCVQWGPFTDPYGGVSSGGVCANPVPAGTAPSGSESVSSSPVTETDINLGSSNSEVASSSSPIVALPVDPTPPGESAYRGSGYPYTQVVEGQVGVSGCPSGFQAANGLIVDVGTHKVYTECWPERAWVAYRLGGEAWDLYKATGGSYDPSVEIDRRNKVLLLRSKAKSIAEAAAQITPGVERCSSWSGFGESGRECAYAFVRPNGQQVTVSDSVSSSSSTSSSTSSTTASGPSSTTSSTTSSATQSSISVELSSATVEGTSATVARQSLLITPDSQEAASISQLASSISALSTMQRSAVQTLPKDKSLNYKVTSLTPKICQASSLRVRISSTGVCKVGFDIVDTAGNRYQIVKKIRRSF